MKKGNIMTGILIIGILLTTLLSGCNNYNTKETIQDNASTLPTAVPPVQSGTPGIRTHEDDFKEVEKLGGISLGMDRDQVIKILGSGYKEEEYADDAGYLREEAYQWTYDGDAVLIIGKNTEKVLRMNVYSDKLKTSLSIKVGDSAQDAFNQYSKKYSQLISRHSQDKLEGWFDIGGEMVLIFDTNKDDKKLVNDDITSESKIQAIYLQYQNSID